MRVSLNLIKKYVDIPSDITLKQIATDLTIKTVEVEDTQNTKDKFHDIVVGKILEVKQHPNADRLRVCMVDIGEKDPVQIVCGGSNLYENELVVVSKPGAEVYWHGQADLVKIEKTKMRGEDSYGMICGAEEVYLEGYFPPKSETEIVDLSNVDCHPGQNISEVIDADDFVIEIDNKSLTNRPDLWGHYGLARELSTIYNVPLKPLEDFDIPKDLPKYSVEIKDTKKCQRYVAVEIDNVYEKESPLWMKTALINCGLRPINAIVDITNYVMIAIGQPLHAFDKTHVDGNKIIVRNAKENEELLLLDNNSITLGENDLVICNEKEPMALAGIKGGAKDSILPETTGIVLEVANFTASTIRKSSKRFDEKTDAGIRFEKGIDTCRVDQGLKLALNLFKELFEDAKIVSFNDVYPVETKCEKIDVPEKFLDERLGKKIAKEEIERILTHLGYEVDYKDNVYHVIAPVYRSTGDVSMKDDVLGDIARIIGYNNFEKTPLPVKFDSAVIQNDVTLERRIKEYLSLHCGFNEIFTYSWSDEKFINASRIDKSNMIKLATPPSPETAHLRNSLIPNMLEVIAKNLRYFDDFNIYEIAQVYKKGEYHESSDDETLPIHEKMLCASITGKDAYSIFYELKGVVESLSRDCHMEDLEFKKGERPSWADVNAYLDITLNGDVIGQMGLVSIAVMQDAKIKHSNVALMEISVDKLVPLSSRTNHYEAISTLPLIEKDLSILVDENVSWSDVENAIKKSVKKLEFIEEYRGSQIPEGKKSFVFKLKIENQDETKTSEEIGEMIASILKKLNKQTGATLREE